MAEPTARHLSLPSGLLELCALLGASQDSLRGLEQVAQKRGVKSVSSLAPEVLSVFVPPFTTKDDGQVAGASCTLGKARRRSFRKKREKPRIESWKSHPGDSKGPDSEDVTIPGGVDLLALPQLCFPGGVCVASEPKEDYIHFLVLTDVCGNRTYGVVAQYYRPLHPLRDSTTLWSQCMQPPELSISQLMLTQFSLPPPSPSPATTQLLSVSGSVFCTLQDVEVPSAGPFVMDSRP